jgi:hypothetical protein
MKISLGLEALDSRGAGAARPLGDRRLYGYPGAAGHG